MELFKAKDLGVKVNDRYILKNLNFEISDNEITVIYSSSNESLKLLEALSYKNKPVSGSLFYGNEDLSLFSKSNLEEWRIKDVQYVSIKDSLFDELSVKENIYLPLILNRIEEDNDYMSNLFEELDLLDLIDEKVTNIGKLDYYKTLIARSLSLKPFVLLLENIERDFTKAELDILLDSLTHINNLYKTAIVISTSNINLKRAGSRTLVIEDGTIKND